MSTFFGGRGALTGAGFELLLDLVKAPREPDGPKESYAEAYGCKDGIMAANSKYLLPKPRYDCPNEQESQTNPLHPPR